MQKRKLSLQKRLKNNDRITAPKQKAPICTSFLPTFCPFGKFVYFYVGKKEYSISATNKYCVGRKHFGFKAALLLAPKRYKQQIQQPTLLPCVFNYCSIQFLENIR